MTNKVNVLTAEDVTFRPYHWWSDWVDVAVFNYGGYGYLLQMKLNRRNAKKFKTIPFHGRGQAAHPTTQAAEDLVSMREGLERLQEILKPNVAATNGEILPPPLNSIQKRKI